MGDCVINEAAIKDPSLNLLTPLEAAAKLNELGICGKFSPAKLANARSDGTGPPSARPGESASFTKRASF
jgi:hypothetical protein